MSKWIVPEITKICWTLSKLCTKCLVAPQCIYHNQKFVKNLTMKSHILVHSWFFTPKVEGMGHFTCSASPHQKVGEGQIPCPSPWLCHLPRQAPYALCFQVGALSVSESVHLRQSHKTAEMLTRYLHRNINLQQVSTGWWRQSLIRLQNYKCSITAIPCEWRCWVMLCMPHSMSLWSNHYGVW